MAAQVDPVAGQVRVDGRSWPFDLDLRSGSATVEVDGRLLAVRPLTWQEKLRLARHAHLGGEFVDRHLVRLCLAGDPAPDGPAGSAVAAAARWLNDPDPAVPAAPLDRLMLGRVTAEVCREMGLRPGDLAGRDAAEVEELYRAVARPSPAETPAETGAGDGPSRIQIVPDGTPDRTGAAAAERAEPGPPPASVATPLATTASSRTAMSRGGPDGLSRIVIVPDSPPVRPTGTAVPSPVAAETATSAPSAVAAPRNASAPTPAEPPTPAKSPSPPPPASGPQPAAVAPRSSLSRPPLAPAPRPDGSLPQPLAPAPEPGASSPQPLAPAPKPDVSLPLPLVPMGQPAALLPQTVAAAPWSTASVSASAATGFPPPLIGDAGFAPGVPSNNVFPAAVAGRGRAAMSRFQVSGVAGADLPLLASARANEARANEARAFEARAFEARAHEDAETGAPPIAEAPEVHRTAPPRPALTAAERDDLLEDLFDQLCERLDRAATELGVESGGW